MIFEIHIAVALEMIALVAGSYLIIKAWQGELKCKLFGKIVGVFVVTVTALTFICTAVHSFKYGMAGHDGGLHHGHGKGEKGMMHKMDPEMRDKMMKDCPMMKMMMEDMKEDE